MYLADPTTRTLTEEILVIPTVLTRTRPQSVNLILGFTLKLEILSKPNK